MKKIEEALLNNADGIHSGMHWVAFTYIAALYFVIISAQSYSVFIENLLVS